MTTEQITNELPSNLWELIEETGDVNFTLNKIERIVNVVIDDNVQDDGLFLEMVLDYAKLAKREVQELSQKIKELHHMIDN